MSKKFLIQSGGGMMGIGPAEYLAQYEMEFGKSIPSLFHGYVGTSIGSVNSAFLAMGFPALELENTLRKQLPGYFGQRTFKSRFGFCPKYKDSNIMKSLQYYFGDKTMDQSPEQLFLVAWDARKKDLKVFSREDKGIKIKDAIRASIAAPTYFAPVGKRLVDGGLGANDPLLCGMAALFQNGTIKADTDFKFLSLVTSGENPERKPIKSEGTLIQNLNEVIVPALTAGNASDVDFIAQSWLNSLQKQESLFRVKPNSPDFEMDDCSKLDQVRSIWRKQFDRDVYHLHKFLGE